MRLIVYGTLRKGEALAYIMPTNRKCEILELCGLQLYVVGDCPGAKLSSKKNKAIVELCEFDLTRKSERRLLHNLDIMEGVDLGLYERSYIDTPKGEALVYTICGSIKGCPEIKDWKEWQNSNKNKKINISNSKIVIHKEYM